MRTSGSGVTDPAGEQRAGVGRPVKQVEDAEPGRSYFTALGRWPGNVAGLTHTELTWRIGCGPSSLSECVGQICRNGMPAE
jgi:hypothetical protein